METTEITIRDAKLEDSEFIADFQLKMAMETEEKKLDLEVVLPAVKKVFTDGDKGFYLVAESAGKVVGSLMVTYEWSDWRNCFMWYIQSVFVEKECRGKGAFTMLYNEVVARAKEAGVMFVRLYVETENERAQRTYEKLGMKRMPYYMYDVKIT